MLSCASTDEEAMNARCDTPDYLFLNLQDMMPYQAPDAHQELAEIVNKAIEKGEGGLCTITIVGPKNSGKSMTCHALKWSLLVPNENIVVARLPTPPREVELTLAEELVNASLGDPSILFLIIDDVHLMPHRILQIDRLRTQGYLETPNGASFKLSVKTLLLTVFTCIEDTPIVPEMGHIIVYTAPRTTNTQ